MLTPARDEHGRRAADNESAVNVSPQTDVKAVSRLLEHCVRVTGLVEAPPRGRERLEAVLGGELAHRLVGALAGDHRLPARSFAD
jgi:hypothetical protein